MTDSGLQTATLNPEGQTFKLLGRELGVTTFGLNLITLRPKQRLRIHLHERQEEVYLVIEGELTLIVEGKDHVLKQGTLARVAPKLRRQLTNPGDERVLVLAGGTSGEHEARDARAWVTWDEEGQGRSPQEVPLPADLP
jgi:uncharacterized cupin superfamily protein